VIHSGTAGPLDREEDAMDKLLLRPDEAAEILSIGRSRVYELLRDGTLPTVRLGGSIRIPAEALRRWVEEQRGTGERAGRPVGS
jgi:excisionase family DNA binding protein